MVAVIHNILIMQRYILEMKNNEEATSILQKMKKKKEACGGYEEKKMDGVCGGNVYAVCVWWMYR